MQKSYYHIVSERMYSDFQVNIFGENVFVIDYVLANVNSAGVKSADAYILT